MDLVEKPDLASEGIFYSRNISKLTSRTTLVGSQIVRCKVTKGRYGTQVGNLGF